MWVGHVGKHRRPLVPFAPTHSLGKWNPRKREGGVGLSASPLPGSGDCCELFIGGRQSNQYCIFEE